MTGEDMAIRSLTSDCRDVLRTLPDDCVVTSPLYFGLASGRQVAPSLMPRPGCLIAYEKCWALLNPSECGPKGHRFLFLSRRPPATSRVSSYLIPDETRQLSSMTVLSSARPLAGGRSQDGRCQGMHVACAYDPNRRRARWARTAASVQSQRAAKALPWSRGD
jgi:hypothetical protein